MEAAQTADRAASLRVHLVAGEPCPVCEQPVVTVPGKTSPKLKAAREAYQKAEQAAQAASLTADAEDRKLRELDRGLAAANAQHEAAVKRLGELDSTVEGVPLSQVEAGLAAIATGEQVVREATEAVKLARQAVRAAGARARAAEEQLRDAWRTFDQVRDAVAPMHPPAADREQLVGSWDALRAWAVSTAEERFTVRDANLAVAQAALAAITTVSARLEALVGASFGADPAGYRQATALSVQRATAAHERVLERREQAARLGEQVARHEREAQVAKSLAQHLRANQFERWLLTEALDALVTGASRILRELSSGQYDLTHDKGEFFVVDHGDAGLRRGVRTLSGGETFQASLALALALSEQLAGLTSASASLESIMLDEGFGTLDADTLDVVASTLENLAARGDRMVGVVTHVAALAERIPVRFELSRDARGAAHIVRAS
jgi:exonuclease SbcC